MLLQTIILIICNHNVEFYDSEKIFYLNTRREINSKNIKQTTGKRDLVLLGLQCGKIYGKC